MHESALIHYVTKHFVVLSVSGNFFHTKSIVLIELTCVNLTMGKEDNIVHICRK